jgi:hypothetical protein
MKSTNSNENETFSSDLTDKFSEGNVNKGTAVRIGLRYSWLEIAVS